MAADNEGLSEKYELVKLNVASGTQLATRAADVVNNLSKTSANKPIIVFLTTRSRNANKLISIVEIAKRELKAKGIRVFQYNALSSEKLDIERDSKLSNGSRSAGNGAEKGDESDGAFETMGSRTVDGPKQRLVPVMTTYLGTTSIKELQADLR